MDQWIKSVLIERTSGAYPGLICRDKCMKNYVWCYENYDDSFDGISFQHIILLFVQIRHFGKTKNVMKCWIMRPNLFGQEVY